MSEMNNLCALLIVAYRLLTLLGSGAETQCPATWHESAVLCQSLPRSGMWSQEDCENADCCWLDGTSSKCYQKECSPGYFGSLCQFQCLCSEDSECNHLTGECESGGCRDGNWGIGCMLDNSCTYNDNNGNHYTGKLSTALNNTACIGWTKYKVVDFPDEGLESLADLNSYCRNPRNSRKDRPFCFITRRRGEMKRVEFCSLNSCSCPLGRFSVNCERECHCSNAHEQCSQLTGECSSACHVSWTGIGCQECAGGWFGENCQHRCHCHDANEACDNVTGTCASGCQAGWSGPGCQTACPSGFFGIGCEFPCRCSSTTEVCNRVNGSCPQSGCKMGFTGAGCQIMLPTMIHAPTIAVRMATSLSVNWREWKAAADRGSGPVVGYVLYYKAMSNTQWLSIAANLTRPFTLSGLSPNEVYYVTVAAVHQSGAIGLPSPNASEKTCGRPLSGPVSIKLTTIRKDGDESGLPDDEEEVFEWIGSSDSTTDDSINLSVVWKPPLLRQINCMRLVQSRVYLRYPQQDSFVYTTHVNGTGSFRTQLPNINPYTNLTVGVTVLNNAGLESDMVEDTYIGRSGPVEGLDVSEVSSTVLVVQWNPPAVSNGIISNYLVSHRLLVEGGCVEAPSEWSRLQMISPTSLTTTFQDLSPYSKYQVKVMARTPAGLGQVSSAVGVTGSIEPPPVVGLHLVNATTTAARFVWMSMDCRSHHGSFVGYEFQLTELARLDENEMRIIANEVTNRTERYFPNLIPFTNYSFELFFRNGRYPGPKSTIEFMTLEDVPPAPRNFSLNSRLSDSLGLTWLKPRPSNGILTQFILRYKQNIGNSEFTVVEMDSLSRDYTIEGLQPYTAYLCQIQAATRAGNGVWSEPIEFITDESIPSEPMNFVNFSRSSKEATFHWLPPLRPSGLLRSYEISCSLKTNSHVSPTVVFNFSVDSSLREYTVTNLRPGICYVCTLRAVNGKGPGPGAARLFWTEPVLSDVEVGLKIDKSKASETTVSVLLIPPEELNIIDEVDKIYRVVVQTMDSAAVPGRRRRRQNLSKDPCGLPNHELVDVKMADKKGYACYVAADIVVVSREHLFIVGDGKTYGGFHNTPLKPDYNYRIWFGMVVTVDGAVASSYSFVDVERHAEVVGSQVPPIDGDQVSTSSSVIGVVIAVVLFVVIAIVVIVILVYRRRETLCKRNPKSGIFVDGPNTGSRLYDPRDPTNVDEDNVSEYEAEVTPFINGQTTLSSIAVKSRPIAVSDLFSFVAAKKLATDGGLKAEYLSIPSQLLFSAEIARKPENKLCNRYGNIIAYDHSRVILDCTNPGESSYINANYVDGFSKPAAYVSTQGPSKATLNDFWRMVWQLKSSRVVMLCNLVEDGRRKCEQYWPDSGVSNYGELAVELIAVETFADFKIRTFMVSKRGDCMTVMHFHFTAWPDHGVPSQPTSLLSFRRKYHCYDVGNVTGPVVIHCSAGVGRTGTFTALDYLLDQAKSESQVDILGCVYKLRQSRVNMVQTPEQYLFLHDALLEALATGDTAIPCNEFRERYAYLQEINPATGKLRCLEEFQSLVSIQANTSSNKPDGSKLDGLSADNISKNRFPDIVPPNRMCRPLLLTCTPGSTDYINAVFVDGYKQRDAFIVTQMPMPNTVVDFWTMILDQSCRTIVMLNDFDPSDKSIGEYFPRENSRQTYGQFIVELATIGNEANSSIIVRDFNISSTDQPTEAPVSVRHFQFMAWPPSSSVPTNKSAVLSLLSLLENWQQRSGNGVITVHCMDGVTRCGLLCSLSYMLERLKAEQDVDVFHSVKHVRVNRPQLIPTYEQYGFLCDMAIEYLDCFETYSNFK